MKSLQLLFVFCLFSLLAITTANAQRISIQGTLKDDNGAAVADGSYLVTFKLYTQDVGGTAAWEETDNVAVKGGIYSHLLGSVTALDPAIFENTLYLGVVVSGSELSPRTELTYSPYALSVNTAINALNLVGCTGSVGDIKYSILAPTDFYAENGNCWMLMDGSAIPAGNRLNDDFGFAAVPDMRGYFVRASNYGGGADPDRVADPTIAETQTDDVKPHTHSVSGSTSSSSHSHSYGYYNYTSFQYEGTGGSPNTQYGVGSWTSSTTGSDSHSHSISGTANNNSGSETRPKNRNFYLYIRVD